MEDRGGRIWIEEVDMDTTKIHYYLNKTNIVNKNSLTEFWLDVTSKLPKSSEMALNIFLLFGNIIFYVMQSS